MMVLAENIYKIYEARKKGAVAINDKNIEWKRYTCKTKQA
jgi:hypothetical protein